MQNFTYGLTPWNHKSSRFKVNQIPELRRYFIVSTHRFSVGAESNHAFVFHGRSLSSQFLFEPRCVSEARDIRQFFSLKKREQEYMYPLANRSTVVRLEQSMTTRLRRVLNRRPVRVGEWFGRWSRGGPVIRIHRNSDWIVRPLGWSSTRGTRLVSVMVPICIHDCFCSFNSFRQCLVRQVDRWLLVKAFVEIVFVTIC